MSAAAITALIEPRKSTTSSHNRKSTFAKRQKYFVRNFIADQFSPNQYLFFPGNKNPLNPAPQFLRSQTHEQIKRTIPTAKTNLTDISRNNRRKNNSSLSIHSHFSQKSAPSNTCSLNPRRTFYNLKKNLKKDDNTKLPSLFSIEDDYLKDLSIVHKKTDNIERDMILNTEMKKLQALANQNEEKRNRIFRKRTLDERFASLQRFRKAVRKVIIYLSMLEIHKLQMQRTLLGASENWIHKTFKETLIIDNNYFDKNYYSRPKEPNFPKEAKRILNLKPNERTEEMIRFVTLSLNFCVPEFLTFPLHMQRKIAQFSFYQEYEPSRVVMRQGHVPLNFYIILSGNALVSKACRTSASTNQLSNNLKRGDCYGEQDIIKNQLRSHTITVYGNTPCGMLQIEKEDFFKIQTPVLDPEERFKFLCNKVPFLKIISYPIEKLRYLPRTTCFSIYYRLGQSVSENSCKDEWIYIIKSGTCRVLKKVRFDNSALNIFQSESTSKRQINGQKQIILSNADHTQNSKMPVQYERCDGNYIIKKDQSNQKNYESIVYPKKSQYTYLEMRKLDEGDIFGIHDLVFTDPKEINPLILVSDGAELILLKRDKFMDMCDGEALLRMKFNLPPYPNDESFIIKYFSYLQWGNFKHKVSSNT